MTRSSRNLLGRLRAQPRGTLLLGVAILLVFAAAASNVPETVKHSNWRKEDRTVYLRWEAAHGGRRAYGLAISETHSRNDVICAPHYRGLHTRHDADYRVWLVVDSHGSGPARLVRVARGPVKVKPTAAGPKCGNPPPG